MAQQTFLIVGGGLAGAKAAQTLREEGFGGRIQLVGAEAERPYERPPLSKGYLTGAAERDSVYVHGPDWYAEQDVELRLGSPAVDLDPAGHELRLGSGERLGYDKLLLATGSSARRLPDTDLEGLYYLRDVQDADRLRAALTVGGRQVVVVGAGWIGMEAAAAARGHGNAVTVVDPQPVPLRAALGDELGRMFADLHREHGVTLRLSTGVRDFTRSQGAVTGVVTEAGETLPADVVVVGVGAVPNVQLAVDGRPDGRQRDRRRRGPAPPPTRTSTPPATSPTPPTRCSGGTSGSSTGPTRCTAARRRPGRCWASTSSTTASRTSSPTSTTSAWSSPATSSPAATTSSSTAATAPDGRSSPSGWPGDGSWPA